MTDDATQDSFMRHYVCPLYAFVKYKWMLTRELYKLQIWISRIDLSHCDFPLFAEFFHPSIFLV